MATNPLLEALTGAMYSPQQDVFGIVGSSIGQTAPALINPYGSTGTNLGIGIGSALLTGLLGGIAERRTEQRNADLFKAARALSGALPEERAAIIEQNPRLSSMGSLLEMQDIETAQEQKALQAQSERDAQKEFAKSFYQNPAMTERALERMGYDVSIENGMPTMAKRAVDSQPEEISPAAFPGATATAQTPAGPESLENKIKRTAQTFMDEGAPPGTAYEMAAKALESDRLQLKGADKKIEELRTTAKQLKDVADTAEVGVQGAGNTGGILNTPRNVASFLYALVSPEEQRQRDSQAVLDSVKADVVKLSRAAGAGSVSDYEAKMFLGSGPSSDKTPSENQAIIEKMRAVGSLAEDKADFLEWYKEKNQSLAGAEQLWREYTKANPLTKKVEGKLVFNQDRAPWQDVLVGALSGESPQSSFTVGSASAGELPTNTEPAAEATEPEKGIGGSFVQGIQETPQVIKALFDPATYKEAFGGNEETGLGAAEKAANTVGAGASMLAGGALGAKTGLALGAFGGPPGAVAGTLLGGALGAAGGYLGFGSATEAGSEVAGVGTEKTVIPSKKDIEDAAYLTGQGLTLGALAKAAGAGINAATKAVKGTASIPQGIAQAIKEDVVGIKGSDIAKSATKRALTYIDDSGKTVPVTKATEATTALDQSLKIIDQDGFFKKISNNPSRNVAALEQTIEGHGKALSELRQAGGNALKEAWNKLSDVQKKQFPLERNPATGKGGFNPDFSAARQAIKEIGKTDPQMVRTLTSRLDSVIKSWDKSSRSYDMLQKFKEQFGKSTKFDKATSPREAKWNDIKKQLYGTFADAQTQAFDFAMSQTNPQMVGALTKQNAVFSAYKNVEPIMQRTLGRSRIPQINLADLKKAPAQVVTRAFPAQALPVVEGTNKILGRGASAVAAAGEKTAALTKSTESVIPFAQALRKAGKGAMAAEAETGMMDLPKAASNERPSEKKNVAFDMKRLPPMIQAVIKTESAGDAKAVSKAGAKGLMQIMPEHYKRLGITNPFDPEQSVKAGQRILAEEFQRFGDMRLALAAYNAGAPRVQRAIKRAGSKRYEDIYAYLPEETRKYVPKVLRNYYELAKA